MGGGHRLERLNQPPGGRAQEQHKQQNEAQDQLAKPFHLVAAADPRRSMYVWRIRLAAIESTADFLSARRRSAAIKIFSDSLVLKRSSCVTIGIETNRRSI